MDPKRLRVICARPGGRIWECNIDGNVLKTHKFKSILGSEQPTSIDSSQYEFKQEAIDFIKHQINEQLFDLQNLTKSFVLGYTSNAFYIFDIERSNIVLWSNNFGNIHSIRVTNDDANTILLFTTDQKAYTFRLNQLEESFDETIDNDEIIYEDKLDYSDGTQIIYQEKQSNYINMKKKLTDTNLIEQKPVGLSEEDKILQNLFFIYKSLKVSKFNLKERYAELFDMYDFQYIKRLLNVLEAMIVENDGDVEQSEAKKICAEIYLGYIKVDSIRDQDLSEELEGFLIECLILVNSVSNSDCHSQRCKVCNFPLTVSRFELQYRDIAEIIVKRLVKAEKGERLLDIIVSIPAVLGILLKVLITNTSTVKFGSEFDNIVDIFFACGTQPDIEQYIHICDYFITFNFWSDFLSRLIQLHNQHTVQCIRCKELSQIDFEMVQSDTFYTYNYAFNQCVNLISGSAALKLCTMAAKYIPRNGINRNFYIECLLRS